MSDLMNYLPAFVLWGSAVAFWIAFVLLMVLFFVSDVKENGVLAFISLIVFIAFCEIWGSFKILSYLTLTYGLIYLGVGLVYAFIRTYFYGRKKLNTIKYNDNPTETEIANDKKYQIKDRLEHLKGNFFRWWFLFPVSLINWIVSDLFSDVFNWVYAKLKTLIEKIFYFGVNSANKDI